MSMFGEFYVPSITNNVVDFAACRARHDLHQVGAIDREGNFYVDQPFDPDWVAKFRRKGFYVIGSETEVETEF